MKLITLVVDKQQVLTEVDKHASYVGAKNGAYEQLRKKDADNLMLEKAWKEACELVTSTLGEYLAKVTTAPVQESGVTCANYHIMLRVPDGYNEAVTDSVKQGLFAFFAEVVLQKWFEVCGVEAQVQLANSNATMMLQDVKHKILMRQRPLRPGKSAPTIPDFEPCQTPDEEEEDTGTGSSGVSPAPEGGSGTGTGGTATDSSGDQTSGESGSNTSGGNLT